MQNTRLTYSDLCCQMPEPKFRHCLLRMLAVLFKLMCSYYEVISFHLKHKGLQCQASNLNFNKGRIPASDATEESTTSNSLSNDSGTTGSGNLVSHDTVDGAINGDSAASSSGSPRYYLREEAVAFVSQTLQRRRNNLRQLTTSCVSVLFLQLAFINS